MAEAACKTGVQLQLEITTLSSLVQAILRTVKQAKAHASEEGSTEDANLGEVHEAIREWMENIWIDSSTSGPLKKQVIDLIAAYKDARYRFEWTPTEYAPSWKIDVDNGSSQSVLVRIGYDAAALSIDDNLPAGDYVKISNSENGNEGLYAIVSQVGTVSMLLSATMPGTDNTEDTSLRLQRVISTY